MALRLRGRELVVPAEAWAHFYPAPLVEARADPLTGTPIMGVPSRDEVARTRSWLHQKVAALMTLYLVSTLHTMHRQLAAQEGVTLLTHP